MNKKGFSLIAALIGLIILLFVLQFAMKQYKKSLSNVSAFKVVSSGQKASNTGQDGSFKDGILLKASVLPQLDNLLREQQSFLVLKGSYAKNITNLNATPAPVPQYTYGVSDNKDGWVVWVKKTGGSNKLFLSKNIKTKQLCCKDIDAGACQIVSVANIACPF